MAQELIGVGTTANDGEGDTWRNAMVKTNSNFTELFADKISSMVVVKTAADLSGTLQSGIAYFIDGFIDMGSQSIEVPAGGINILGNDAGVSRLFSSFPGYTMFTSPVGGSGSVLIKDLSVNVTGVGSQAYGLTDVSGFNDIEFSGIAYVDCTSLGTLTGYTQGRESVVQRIGGTPELTLAGTWLGGYFIDVAISRGLTDGAYSIYKAGAGFSMNARFRSNMNVDLPASASYFDFSPSNFVNPSTIQIENSSVTRNGVFDPNDANITPNIAAGDLECSWHGNNGINNTFVGGEAFISAELITSIVTDGVFVDLAGTYTTGDLQHFDSPNNGHIRHLGHSPREFLISGQIVIEGTSNDVIALKVVIFRAATSTFENGKTQTRVINNLQGSRNVAYFNISDNIVLDQNDYAKLQVANIGDTNNVTMEFDSFLLIGARS